MIITIIIILIQMWLVFNLLNSNIHSDSFFIYTYIQRFLIYFFDQIPWMVFSARGHLSKFTLILLPEFWKWDQMELRFGSLGWLTERHLLPTQILQKSFNRAFRQEKPRHRRKMIEGHIIGTGVFFPSTPLQAMSL